MAIDVFILAAGRSSRSTVPKPLRPFGGEPWVVALARMWQRLGATRALATWNPEFPVPAEAAHVGLLIAPNPEVDLGPVRSLQVAARSIGHLMPSTFITPIDCPPPSPWMFRRLVAALGDAAAVHPEYRGKGGHPVLASRGCLEALLDVDPAKTRLDDFLKRQGALRLAVEDPTVVLNWNDDDSWRSWLESRVGDRWDDDQSWRARQASHPGVPTA